MRDDATAGGERAPAVTGGALALFPGMAAAFPGMGRPLTGLRAAERIYNAFSRASGMDVGGLASCAGENVLFSDRAWELAVVAMVDTVLAASSRLHGRFSMLAVSGTTLQKVVPLCLAGKAELAAVIVPTQLLLAGTERAMRTLADVLALDALGVRVLSVRWPLHTSLMLPVAAELERHESRLGRLRTLRHPVYSAMHGSRIETPEEGWRLLVEHLYRPQRFDLAFGAARADGLARFVELGPAGTLKRAVHWLARGETEVETFPAAGPRPPKGEGQR